MPNKVTYSFSPNRLLDLCLALTLPNTYIAHIETSDTIPFVLASQKKHYNRSHQPLFMRVGDWAILKFHKGYSIFSSIAMTKKLTQQYVNPLWIVEKISRLVYKLDILSD